MLFGLDRLFGKKKSDAFDEESDNGAHEALSDNATEVIDVETEVVLSGTTRPLSDLPLDETGDISSLEPVLEGKPENTNGELPDVPVAQVAEIEEENVQVESETVNEADSSPVIENKDDESKSESISQASEPLVAHEDPQEISRKIAKTWAKEQRAIGGKNPLLQFDDEPDTRLDLTGAHPGGIAQFITGHKTLLSNLVRDDQALRTAKVAAARITAKATEMRAERGLSTVHMGVGLVSWEYDGENFNAPVLLRPLAIRRFGDDFEIKLKPQLLVNPDLVYALKKHFGITVDAQTLLELSQTEGMFKPRPVLDYLRQTVHDVPNFKVQSRLVVSSFLSVARGLVYDPVGHDTTVLQAMRGEPQAQERLQAMYRPVNIPGVDERAPETDRALYDTDNEQDDVLAQIEAGHSLVVKTLPGTGGTQTVVNAIGSLIRGGKRVLVVSPRRATLDGISHRLSRVGLQGLTVSPAGLRRTLVEGIRRNEQPKSTINPDIDQALVRLRKHLRDYESGLEHIDPVLGTTPLQALRELAKLASMHEVPQTHVRLNDDTLKSLTLDRSEIAEMLEEVANLGQFQYGPDDSPWYGVKFTSTDEAKESYLTAVELSETKLPRLLEIADKAIENTQLRTFETIKELGIYLRLLSGVRETLDRFAPEIYDRSLTEIIAAHAPKGADTMTLANRKRLKKLAQEYVRPGVSAPADMYQALVQVQQQRVLWQRYCQVPGTRPEVPSDINEVLVSFDAVFNDLAELDRVLQTPLEIDYLQNLTLGGLVRRLSDLAQESEVLNNITERTAIIERLTNSGLSDLLDDLSARHVTGDLVTAELELAWWQSALEYLLRSNPELLSANTGLVERLQSDFRIVDDAHVGGNGAQLATQLAEMWRVAILDYADEANALRAELRKSRPSIAALFANSPHLMGALAPLWTVSPYEVPQLPAEVKFDTVVLVDAGAVSVAEVLSALRRGSQVVAFGDPVTQQPRAFELGVRDAHYEISHGHVGESVFVVLSRILPVLQLTRSYRAGGADLTDLLNSRFYDGQIDSLPWAGTYLGHRSIKHVHVADSFGMPDAITGAVEAPEAEVAKVVELVLEHAEQMPRESLMVITASAQHAVKTRQAIYQAFNQRRDLSDFLLGEHAEPFMVGTIQETAALSRDRVIFSLGYGRTPHGGPLSAFGDLSKEGGERLIAVAMSRPRRSMTVVTSFTVDELGDKHLRHGVTELAAVMSLENPEPRPMSLPEELDPMLVELADRLHRLGLQVDINYEDKIPLVAALGDKAIAVDLDFSGTDDSLRHVLRLRPAVLRRLGWHYHRVQSFDLFTDPGQVAMRIARLVGYRSADETEQDRKRADEASNDTGPIEPLGSNTGEIAGIE